jgi:glycosyltransferase involved in cell wall biosynthesis
MSSTAASTPLRIAFCITELNVGGAERCLVDLAIGLDRARFAPTLYSLGPRPLPSNASLATNLDDARIPVFYLDARGAASFPRILRQLRRSFRAEQPDLVQTFLYHANVLGTLAAWSARVPRIVTGLRVAEPLRRWRLPLERFAGRLADRHVAVSEGVARFARERVGLRAEKIVVIPNGVSLSSPPIAPADLTRCGLSPGKRAILFVGRLDEQKGIEWLMEQTPALLARLPQHDLLVVGTGPLETLLRMRAERLRIGNRVHLAGWRDDVPNLLAAADLLVVPSQWEGMPNVVLEAMAAARPIVAFDVEGIADAIGDLASLQIISRDDRCWFIDRVVKIAENSSLQLDFGSENRQRVAAKFRADQMVAAYQELYLEICGRPLQHALGLFR